MIEPGNTTTDNDPNRIQDVRLGRLKLMIVMAKAYLLGCPLGEHRSRAMIENARQLEKNWEPCGPADVETYPPVSPSAKHLFDQRVKLLAVMIKAIAQGYPLREHRRIALINTLDVISERLLFDSDTENLTFLKVA